MREYSPDKFLKYYSISFYSLLAASKSGCELVRLDKHKH